MGLHPNGYYTTAGAEKERYFRIGRGGPDPDARGQIPIPRVKLNIW